MGLCPAAAWPTITVMRTQFLIAAALTMTSCGYRVDDCEQPEKSFTLDEDLDQRRVDALLDEQQLIDRSQLSCAAACESLYLDAHPKGAATSVGACELTLDDEPNDDPDVIVGNVRCDGQGIPQFCVDG
jgi:hypothetical protein